MVGVQHAADRVAHSIAQEHHREECGHHGHGAGHAVSGILPELELEGGRRRPEVVHDGDEREEDEDGSHEGGVLRRHLEEQPSEADEHAANQTGRRRKETNHQKNAHARKLAKKEGVLTS